MAYGFAQNFADSAITVSEGGLLLLYHDRFDLSTSFIAVVNIMVGVVAVYCAILLGTMHYALYVHIPSDDSVDVLDAGAMSDKSNASNGRRRPFIMVLVPIAAASTLFRCVPITTASST